MDMWGGTHLSGEEQRSLTRRMEGSDYMYDRYLLQGLNHQGGTCWNEGTYGYVGKAHLESSRGT
jgi:hypothetical protein